MFNIICKKRVVYPLRFNFEPGSTMDLQKIFVTSRNSGSVIQIKKKRLPPLLPSRAEFDGRIILPQQRPRSREQQFLLPRYAASLLSCSGQTQTSPTTPRTSDSFTSRHPASKTLPWLLLSIGGSLLVSSWSASSRRLRYLGSGTNNEYYFKRRPERRLPPHNDCSGARPTCVVGEVLCCRRRLSVSLDGSSSRARELTVRAFPFSRNRHCRTPRRRDVLLHDLVKVVSR